MTEYNTGFFPQIVKSCEKKMNDYTDFFNHPNQQNEKGEKITSSEPLTSSNTSLLGLGEKSVNQRNVKLSKKNGRINYSLIDEVKRSERNDILIKGYKFCKRPPNTIKNCTIRANSFIEYREGIQKAKLTK